MAASAPPAYAWDWFARQRLIWREVRVRLARASSPVSVRYSHVETRSDVVPLLRADYPHDPVVRDVVDAVIAELVFLGRTDRAFVDLGVPNAPRGMRWWWSALTGEVFESTTPTRMPPNPSGQLTLDEVFEGYGDRSR